MSRSVHVREVSRDVVRAAGFRGYSIFIHSDVQAFDRRYFEVTSTSVCLDDLEGADWYDVLGELANRLGDQAAGCAFWLERKAPSGRSDPFSWDCERTLCHFALGMDGRIDESELPAVFEGFNGYYQSLVDDYLYSPCF